MLLPMVALAAGCALIGLVPALLVGRMAGALESLTRLPADTIEPTLALAVAPLTRVSVAAGVLLVLAGALTLWRRAQLARRPVAEARHLGLRLRRPTPRMQYTASSFAQPLTLLFGGCCARAPRGSRPPAPSRRRPHSPPRRRTSSATRSSAPCSAWRRATLARLRWLQHGRVQLYVLYILLTLVVLLVWKLR